MSHSDYAQWVMSKIVPTNQNRVNEAAHHFQTALELNNNNGQHYEIYINHAYFLTNFKNWKGALEFTKLALQKGVEQGMHGKMLENVQAQEKSLQDAINKEEANNGG